MTDFRKMLKN